MGFTILKKDENMSSKLESSITEKILLAKLAHPTSTKDMAKYLVMNLPQDKDEDWNAFVQDTNSRGFYVKSQLGTFLYAKSGDYVFIVFKNPKENMKSRKFAC